jgi:hypothetical protein
VSGVSKANGRRAKAGTGKGRLTTQYSSRLVRTPSVRLPADPPPPRVAPNRFPA